VACELNKSKNMKIKNCLLIFGLLLPVSTAWAGEKIYWHCDFKDRAGKLDPKNEMAFRTFDTMCTEDGKYILQKSGCELASEFTESTSSIIDSDVRVQASAEYTNCANYKLSLIKREANEEIGKIALQEVCPSGFQLKRISKIKETSKDSDTHDIEFGEYGEEQICSSEK
jgi:hypothetical protein